jgi:nucleoside-diphosphate-sugar epimerase
MNILVTGAAGFIGSHLCERLVRDGHTVTGVDCFTPYYARGIKERNLEGLARCPAFTLAEADLSSCAVGPLLRGVDYVYHLAAMPGLVKSWTEFETYSRCNITATYRLLDAVADSSVRRVIHASTSSVYGKFACGDESQAIDPVSPYGVTKFAAENICRAFVAEKGLSVTVLRYFSVYGPRQRPDMAYNRFIDALLNGRTIDLYGDGHQARSSTYVGDCVEATASALYLPPDEVYNVGGGEVVTINEVIRRLETISGLRAKVRHLPARIGDQRDTAANTDRLTRAIGWRPKVGIDEGLRRQFEWMSRQATPLAA